MYWIGEIWSNKIKYWSKLAANSKINFKVSVKDILKKITKKTKIVFIANPNNPTGTYLEKKELINLRKKLNDEPIKKNKTSRKNKKAR